MYTILEYYYITLIMNLTFSIHTIPSNQIKKLQKENNFRAMIGCHFRD